MIANLEDYVLTEEDERMLLESWDDVDNSTKKTPSEKKEEAKESKIKEEVAILKPKEKDVIKNETKEQNEEVKGKSTEEMLEKEPSKVQTLKREAKEVLTCGYENVKKSKANKKLTGVCAGMANYFGFDPIFLRLPIVLFVLIYGSNFIATVTKDFVMMIFEPPFEVLGRIVSKFFGLLTSFSLTNILLFAIIALYIVFSVVLPKGEKSETINNKYFIRVSKHSLCGVSRGINNYFGINVWIVRAIFIISLWIFKSLAIIIYLALVLSSNKKELPKTHL